MWFWTKTKDTTPRLKFDVISRSKRFFNEVSLCGKKKKRKKESKTVPDLRDSQLIM